jgi:hypothetical protein
MHPEEISCLGKLLSKSTWGYHEATIRKTGNEFPELKERVLLAFRSRPRRRLGNSVDFVCGAAQAMPVAGTGGWVEELFDSSASTGSMRTSSGKSIASIINPLQNRNEIMASVLM